MRSTTRKNNALYVLIATVAALAVLAAVLIAGTVLINGESSGKTVLTTCTRRRFTTSATARTISR